MQKQLITFIILLAAMTVFSGCTTQVTNTTNQSPANNVNPEQSSKEADDPNIEADTATSSDIDTSDWQTYRNEELGFEVKYPAQLSTKDWADKTSNWILYLNIGKNRSITDGAVSVSLLKGESEFDEEKILWPIPRTNLKITDARIGKKDLYKAKKVEVNYQSVDGDVNKEIYYYKKNNKLFRIDYDKNKSDMISKESFDSIISSFIFID